MQSFLETQLYNNPSNKIQKESNNTLIAGVILASGLFVGSSIALPHDTNIAYAGFVGSIATVGVIMIRRIFSRSI
jgi:uncharacterized membrane protein (UPF0136 family)